MGLLRRDASRRSRRAKGPSRRSRVKEEFMCNSAERREVCWTFFYSLPNGPRRRARGAIITGCGSLLRWSVGRFRMDSLTNRQLYGTILSAWLKQLLRDRSANIRMVFDAAVL